MLGAAAGLCQQRHDVLQRLPHLQREARAHQLLRLVPADAAFLSSFTPLGNRIARDRHLLWRCCDHVCGPPLAGSRRHVERACAGAARPMTTTIATASDFASGKGHKDENFPVASLLIKPALRAPVMAFYRFARLADDIADHETASPSDKLERLAAMEASLLGRAESEPAAVALRIVQAERGLDPQHALDLLEAFRRDVTKLRYADWDDLIDYCRYSAMPVGRFVLDVHGEDRATWPANDALCAALQIVNHLQDCGKDYRAIDRVYLPGDMMAAAGITVEQLGAAHSTPQLLEQSAGFSAAIRDRRLGVEVAIIQRLAESLAARLRRRDPLADRVHHGKAEALLLALGAALPRMVK